MSGLLEQAGISAVSIEDLRKAGIMPDELIKLKVAGHMVVASGASGYVYDTIGIDMKLQEEDLVPILEGIAVIHAGTNFSGAVIAVNDIEAKVTLWDDEPTWGNFGYLDAQLEALATTVGMADFDPDTGKDLIAAWGMSSVFTPITTSGAVNIVQLKDGQLPVIMPKTKIKDGKLWLAVFLYKSTASAHAVNFPFVVHLYVRWVSTSVADRIRHLEKAQGLTR